MKIRLGEETVSEYWSLPCWTDETGTADKTEKLAQMGQ